MIYAPRYIFNSDLNKNICSCVESKKYRVLFSHCSCIENVINNKVINMSSKVVGICSKCSKIYKFEIESNPNMSSISDIKTIEEVKKDIQNVKENIYKEYKSYGDTLCFKSDYHLVKVISEKYDNYKKFTDFIYIEK